MATFQLDFQFTLAIGRPHKDGAIRTRASRRKAAVGTKAAAGPSMRSGKLGMPKVINSGTCPKIDNFERRVQAIGQNLSAIRGIELNRRYSGFVKT